MKDNDGPVFASSKDKQSQERKFNRMIGKDAQKTSFKPAFSKDLAKKIDENKLKTHKPLNNSLNPEEIDDYKDTTQTPDLSTDYSVPFLEKASKVELKPFENDETLSVETLGGQGSLFNRERFMANQAQIEEEQKDLEIEEEVVPSPRASYQPTFQSNRKVQPEVSSDYVPTSKSIPKPYRPAIDYEKINLETRELSKRLVKQPNTFILFEE